MKFILTESGEYVAVRWVKRLFITEDAVGKTVSIMASSHGIAMPYRLASFSDMTSARENLQDLVAQIEQES